MADGIEIPLSVETDGSQVTIERLAASLVELTDKVDKLGQTAEKTKKAVQFTALIEAGRLIKDAWSFSTKQFADFSAELDKASAFGSKFQNMALQFNTSAEALQKLQAAGKPFGVSVDQMARSLNLLDRNFAKISPQFKKFGIDVRDVTGAKDGADRFLKIAEGIGKIKDPAQQAAASFALLKDRSGAFLKLIRDPDGMKAAIKDFEDFGLAVSDNAVGALDKFGNQKQLIGDIFTSFKTNILGAIVSSGAFQEAIRVVTEWFGKLSKWAKDNEQSIKDWTTKAILVAIDVLIFLAGTIIPKVIDAFTGLKVIVAGLQAEFKILGDGAILLWNVLKNPLGANDAWAAFKLAMDDTMSDLGKKVKDAMTQNAAWQGTAKGLADEFGKVRDRIANAAKTSENFAAPIKAATDAAEALDDATRKAVDSMKLAMQGFVGAEEIQKTEVALRELGGAAKLADEAITSSGAKFQHALASGQQLTGEVLKLAEAYLVLAARTADAEQAEAQFAQQQAVDAESLKKAQASLVAFGFDRGKGVSDLKKAFDTMKEATNGVWGDLGDSAIQSFLEKLTSAAQGAHGEFAKQGEAMREAVFSGLSRGGKIDFLAKEVAANAESFAKPFREMAQKDLAEVIEALYGVDAALAKDVAGVVQFRDETGNAVKTTEIFRGALSVAADAAQALGQTGLGGLIGNILSAAAAGEQAAESFRKAVTSKEKLMAGLAVAGAGAQVAGNIFQGNRTNLSGASGALSGASQGAAFGASFGPWGAAIGGLSGALVGFFSGSKFRKIAKDAGKVLGTDLSKEMLEKIQADSKRLGISIGKAALLSLPQAMAESKKAAGEFGQQIDDLLTGIADKSIPAKEGLAAVGEAFLRVSDEALKAGRVGDRVMVNLIQRARELKVESPEMQAFVNEQLDAALEGVHKFVGAITTLSDEALVKLGKESGIIFGAIFDALVSERGIVAAVDSLKGDFDALREKLEKSLGTEAMEAILGPFGAAFATLGDEKLRPIFEGIDGITQAMKGLANSGFLSLDAFAAMQDATAKLFDEAVAGGADMKTALLAVAPSIQAAISAAEQFGVPLDADTQRLKEMAEQNGITFKTDPQEAMLDVMVAIAEVLGADIPESAKRAKAALEDLKSATPGEINVGGGGPSGGTQGPRAVQANVTVNMGINENPMAAADTAAAMRRQTVEWAAEAIEDRVPSIIAAIEGQ